MAAAKIPEIAETIRAQTEQHKENIRRKIVNRRQFIGAIATAVTGGTACIQRIRARESVEKQPPNKQAIPKRLLGKTGIEVSVLILGGFPTMKDPPTKKFHPAELANTALDAGVTYFDTAPAYGNGQSERNFGEVLATRRGEVFLATKTGNRSYDGAMRDVEASLSRLRTDRLDLIQVHSVKAKEDFAKWDKTDSVLKALHKLRDGKIVRFIGLEHLQVNVAAVCNGRPLNEQDRKHLESYMLPQLRPQGSFYHQYCGKSVNIHLVKQSIEPPSYTLLRYSKGFMNLLTICPLQNHIAGPTKLQLHP